MPPRTTRWRSLLDGLRLRCPNCHRGKIFPSPWSVRAQCRACGTDFDASGDWTGAVMVAKFLIGGLILFGVLAIAIVFRPPLWVQAVWVFGVGSILLLGTYRWVKGAWIGLVWSRGDGFRHG